MSLVSDYAFNNMVRIGQDNTDYSQRSLQNIQYSNYILTNNFPDTNYVQFATSQPDVFYSGTHNGPGLAGSIVDVDSKLMIGTEQQRPGGKIQLIQRPYLTIPYLGRGSCDPVLESQLLQGDVVSGKKSVTTISETSYINHSNYPLINTLRESVTNPKFSVEEVAMDGWIRGGSSSRV